MMNCFHYKSPVGYLKVSEDENYVHEIMFVNKPTTLSKAKVYSLKLVKKELDEYFLGKRKTFSFKVKQSGTKFQEKVCKEISKIKFGETLSYKELAIKSGCPKGARAVAMVCKNNNLPIVIPCHRVIASNNRIGGFNSGVKHKRKLLELEGITLP